MRKIILFVILISISIFSGYAAPCYGTKMPGKKRFFTGVQSHIIFKRDLKDDYGKLRSLQSFYLLSYGIFDWLSLDLKGGAGYIKEHPALSDEINYSTGFAGGYGLRLRLYEKNNFKSVLGFQHISVHPKRTYVLGVKNKAVLDDWQVSLLASYDIKRFTPYIGTRWSRLDYIHWINNERKRKMSDLSKSYGLIFGVDFSFTPKIWLNLEGSFFDSESLSASINYQF